ncbi:MAG TPA: DUF6760 family protein [Trebonia sp.]
MRGELRGRTRGEPPGGIVTYAPERLMSEVAYVAYHFHWAHDEILGLEHPDRRRYVSEIADLVNRATEQR